MIRKLSEHLFKVICEGCEREIVLRAGNSWGAYRQLTEGDWSIGSTDLCWDCKDAVQAKPAPRKKKVTA
jgi:hypothetical protein